MGLGDLFLTPPEAGNTSLCVGCLFRLTGTMASFERFFVTPFSQLLLADKILIKSQGRPTPSLEGIKQKHTLGGKRSARFCLYLLFLCLLTEVYLSGLLSDFISAACLLFNRRQAAEMKSLSKTLFCTSLP